MNAPGLNSRIKECEPINILGHNYVFGLAWQYLTGKGSALQLKREQSKKGYNYSVASETDGALGFIKADNNAKPLYSAILQIGLKSSYGGTELFVFEISENKYVVCALNDSLPLYDYDMACTKAEALKCIETFTDTYEGSDIRLISNVPITNYAEIVQLSNIFGQPEADVALRKIPNYSLIIKSGVVISIAILIALVIFGWLANQNRIKEQERMRIANDPNNIYDAAAQSQLSNVGSSAPEVLSGWRKILNTIQVNNNGWTLNSVECTVTNCVVKRSRSVGSFVDHSNSLAGQTHTNREAQIGSNPANAEIVTTINIEQPAPKISINRETVAPANERFRLLASMLQDYSLVPGLQATLNPATLYPNTGANINQIRNPVLKVEWTISHAIWSLNDINLDLEDLTLENLELTKNDDSSWSYKIKGSYYGRN